MPADRDAKVSATRYGLLANELVYSGARVLEACTRLLELSLLADTHRLFDGMAVVIRFLTRLAVRSVAPASCTPVSWHFTGCFVLFQHLGV